MAIDLSGLNEKELLKLQGRIEKALARRSKARLTDARKAAEDAAKKFGYSLEDLTGGTAKAPAARKAPAKARKSKAAAKYKNPANSKETWSGRGRQPKWYKDAVAAGTAPEAMLA